MTYRTPAEPARPLVVRRLPSGDAFRWLKILLGAVLCGGAITFAWLGTYSSVRCVDARCALVQESLLRPTREYPIEPASPPPIALEPATVGKSGRGLRLVLRYPSGSVEILRDYPTAAEAEERRLRAYLADPRGQLVMGGFRSAAAYPFVGFLCLLGLLMFLDGVKVLLWHRLRADPRNRRLTLETILLGAPVRSRSFGVLPATRVGSMPLRPDLRVHVLTLEAPGQPVQRLPIFDRPTTRPLVEEMVAASA